MRKIKIRNLILGFKRWISSRKKPDTIPKINVNGDNNKVTIIIKR